MEEAYTGWAILELMGHRRLAGRVCEADQYGARMVRIDVPHPTDPAGSDSTQFYGGGSIYCLTPCDEATARRFATRNQPAPVQLWELPPARTPTDAGNEPDDDPDAFNID